MCTNTKNLKTLYYILCYLIYYAYTIYTHIQTAPATVSTLGKMSANAAYPTDLYKTSLLISY